jgi:hypothetical protein
MSKQLEVLRMLLSPKVMLAAGLIGAATSAGATAAPASSPEAASAADRANFARSYGKLPMSFEVNRGQAGKQVKFFSRGSGYGLYLTAQEAVLALRRPAVSGSGAPLSRLEASGVEPNGMRTMLPSSIDPAGGETAPAQSSFKTEVIRMQLAGANPLAEPVGIDPLPGTANYFIGNDSSQWHSNVPTYSKVRYPSVYPGIDLVYYGSQRQLEYDFVIAPGASPRPIRLRFAGSSGLSVDADGNLSVHVRDGSLELLKPEVYQLVNGNRQPVSGRFRLLANNTAGFALGRYDHSKPLVIDPILSYSTFLGGTDAEYVVSVAADSAGNAYVTGLTISLDFPTTAGAFQSVNFATAGNQVSTAFISKLNASGTALLYSTYIGGNAIANTLHLQGDYGHAIAVDRTGNAYVTGWTYSANFPVTSGAFQPSSRTASIGLATGFVTKLNPSGTGLIYSTYLGGSLLDEPNALAIDVAGDAFISGLTFSGNFPTTAGAFQGSNRSAPVNGFNAFVTKLNPSGTGLVYSTYLGGSQDTGAYLGSLYWTNPVAVDALGDAYVAGFTRSDDFPVTGGAYQKTNRAAGNGGADITLSKLNPSGSSLLYSTYLGGSTNSYSEGLAVDSAGNAYVGGYTYDLDFPVTKGAFQTINKAASIPTNTGSSRTNGFLTKMNPSGSAPVYSTYLGGTAGPWGGDGILGLAADSAGDAYVVGYVMSNDFPVTANAYQSKNRGATHCCDYLTYATNTFLTEFNPFGTALLYSTYFGGSGTQNPLGPGAYGDSAYGVALGTGGAVYSVGAASSSNFPVSKNSLESSYHSAQNTGYIAEFDLGAPPTTVGTSTTLAPSANSVVPGTPLTFNVSVTPMSGTAIPGGNVTIIVDEESVTTMALNSAGKAAWSTSTLAAGAHYVLASYAGTSTYGASGDGVNEIVTPLTPVISPASGTYEAQQVVSISSPTKAGVLYYTLDGTAPSRFSTTYSGPFVVDYSTTVKAVSVAANDANSAVVTGAYTIVDSPWVLAGPAIGVGSAGATLEAFVNTQGLAGSYVFQFGTSNTAMTSRTPTATLAASSKRVQVSGSIAGLRSKTTYYYEVLATTAAGSTSSKVLSFTTN